MTQIVMVEIESVEEGRLTPSPVVKVPSVLLVNKSVSSDRLQSIIYLPALRAIPMH